MKKTKSTPLKKGIEISFVLILWIITAWLVYPLINLDSIDMSNVKEYLYRSAIGITIMLIFFGKTLFDLIFYQTSSKKMPLLNTIFLTIYSIVLAGGIIFMVAKMMLLYLKNRTTSSLF